MKTALLLIDPQNDFCSPKGSLYVPGADDDMTRLADWIRRFGSELNRIYFTLDSHVKISIFHPLWFRNAAGESPAPFTRITAEEVRRGIWTPLYAPEWTLTYLQELESQSTIQHTIWPEHCLIGTWGHLVYETIMTAILEWSESFRREYKPVIKGLSELTEHYGVFQAEVQRADQSETQANFHLLSELRTFERIYIAGEARSHCVASSVRQFMSLAPDLVPRLTLLEDCCSSVPGFEALGTVVIDKAHQAGVKLSRSTDF